MRKGVLEYVGLFLVIFLLVFIVSSFSITGFQTYNPSTTSVVVDNNSGDDSSSNNVATSPSNTDPGLENIINSGGNSNSDSVDTTETKDLEGFNLISIEDYTSENLQGYPWVAWIIIFVFVVILALSITFFFVFSKFRHRSVVNIRRPNSQNPYISQISQRDKISNDGVENNISSKIAGNKSSGLPLRATQQNSVSPIKPVPVTNIPIKNDPIQSPVTSQPQPQFVSQSQPQSASQPQSPVTSQSQPQSASQPQSPVTSQSQPQSVSQSQPQSVSQSQPQSLTQPQPPVTSQPQPQFVSQPPAKPTPNTLSENLRYIKYYSQNMSKNPNVRIDYLIGQGKNFLKKQDIESAKQIYVFISEEYQKLTEHDDALYNAVVEYSLLLTR